MLANLLFFWDAWPEGEPPPASASSDSDTVYIGAGGGGHKKLWKTFQVDEDFWEARRVHLERLKAEAERKVPHERVIQAVARLAEGQDQAIAETVAQRERAFRLAGQVETAAELNQLSEQILSLTKQLSDQFQQREDDEIALLLLLL